MIKLIANSYKQGYPVVGTMHSVESREDQAKCYKALGKVNLYYPKDVSKALMDAGIENRILCHSGKTVINGEYLDG